MSYSGITKYVEEQDFGTGNRPRYLLLTWVASTLGVAGVQQVVIPTDKSQNVLLIQVEQLVISTDGLGGIISFTDKRLNLPLFNIINATPINISPLFSYIIRDTKFTMVSNSATVQFSVGYIPITSQKIVSKEAKL